MAVHLSRAFRWNVLVWSVIGGALKCSGGLDADADGPPEFGGGLPRFGDPVNSGVNGLQPGANAGANGAGAPNGASGPGQGTEGQGSGVPLDNAANAGANPYAPNSAGAGGSASTNPANPAAGGSSMQGGASADDGLPDGTAGAGTQVPPPVTPPPVTPPPVIPPPVEPPFVGVGCAPGAAFFCEDFESFNVGPAQANAMGAFGQ